MNVFKNLLDKSEIELKAVMMVAAVYVVSAAGFLSQYL